MRQLSKSKCKGECEETKKLKHVELRITLYLALIPKPFTLPSPVPLYKTQTSTPHADASPVKIYAQPLNSQTSLDSSFYGTPLSLERNRDFPCASPTHIYRCLYTYPRPLHLCMAHQMVSCRVPRASCRVPRVSCRVPRIFPRTGTNLASWTLETCAPEKGGRIRPAGLKNKRIAVYLTVARITNV